MCLGINGASTFQGIRSGITTSMKTEQTPYFIGIHCTAHRMNLVVQSLSIMFLVSTLENLFQALYGYFSTSPKRHLELLEFTKLAKIVETEGLKVLQNVKTRWINMLQHLKWVGKEYKVFIPKMATDNVNLESTKANLLSFCYIHMIFNLPCILPMLESMNGLMKFALSRDVFVCDYIITLKTLPRRFVQNVQ